MKGKNNYLSGSITCESIAKGHKNSNYFSKIRGGSRHSKKNLSHTRA